MWTSCLLLVVMLAIPCAAQLQANEIERSANEVFDSLCEAYGLDRIEKEGKLAFQFDRVFYLYGHFPSPWDSIAYYPQGLLYASNNALCHWETVLSKRDTFQVTTIVNDTTVFRYDDDYPDPKKLYHKDIARYRNRIARLMPAVVLRTIRNDVPLLTILSTDDSTIVLGCTGGASETTRLFIDKENYRMKRLEQTFPGDYRGDRETVIRYSDHVVEDGLLYSASVTVKEFGHLSSEWRLRRLDPSAVDMSLFTLPSGYRLADGVPEKPAPDLVWQSVAQHIYAIDFQHLNNRILVVEHEDYCTVIEAPKDSESGELILEMIKEKLPDKPVRYFVFGHHHPDYIGGIRAFAAAGATIITPKGTVNYVRDLLGRRHTLNPDRWEKMGRPTEEVQLLVVEDLCVIGDQFNVLEMYNIGVASAHTRDYLIFYFPESKILFQGDLGRMREGRTGLLWRGEKGVINFVESKGLDVERVLQSFPLSRNGARTDFPYKEWVDMVGVE